MNCEDIVRALRCISTPDGEHEDCTGCPYYKKERLSAELQERLLIDTWPRCDCDKVCMDAADRIERLEAENKALRAMVAKQDQEDAEILSSQPRIDRETVGMLLETRKRLLTMAAWMQHLWEEAEDE